MACSACISPIVRKNFFLVVLFLFSLFSCISKKKTSTSCNSKEPGSSIYKMLQADSLRAMKETGLLSLEDGGKSMIVRAWLCDQAKKKIDIQYYSFASDNTGRIASDFILRAAERGVKVRILVDDVTIHPANKQLRVLDAHENIEIRLYNPGVKFGKDIFYRLRKIFLEPSRTQSRMHTKTMTFDDVVSITGGRNVGDEYADRDKKFNFRDRDVLIIGKETKTVNETFEQFWSNKLTVPLDELVKVKAKYRKQKRFEEMHRYACDPGNFSDDMKEKIRNYPNEFSSQKKAGAFQWVDHVRFIADSPEKTEDLTNQGDGVCTDSIVSLLNNARETVIIQSPYLIFDKEMTDVFSRVIKKGIKVKVLTNSLASIDNIEAFSGYHRDRKKILQMGVEIHEFKPHPKVKYKIMTPEVQQKINYKAILGLHSKTMIIDNKVLLIGSYNFDSRSANLNTECFIIARSPVLCETVGKYIEEEFLEENSWKLSEEFNPDKEAPLRKRWKMFVRKIIPKKYL